MPVQTLSDASIELEITFNMISNILIVFSAEDNFQREWGKIATFIQKKNPIFDSIFFCSIAVIQTFMPQLLTTLNIKYFLFLFLF